MNAELDALFTYEALPSSSDRVLFLLHGTGADQFDLLPLVQHLQSEFQIVSLLGNVREGDMPRFFARFPSGKFDEESILSEAKKLKGFVTYWCHTHNSGVEDAAFVGYSNGANMITALTRLYPECVWTAALLHGLKPLPTKFPDLHKKQFLVTYGESDTLITPEQSVALLADLELAGAAVEEFSHGGGHELTHDEQLAVSSFLQDRA